MLKKQSKKFKSVSKPSISKQGDAKRSVMQHHSNEKTLKRKFNTKKSDRPFKKRKGDEFMEDPNDDDQVMLNDEDVEMEDFSKKWYEEFPLQSEETSSLDQTSIDALNQEARALYESEVSTSLNKTPKSIPKSDYKWIKSVIVKGTLSDKIAAFVLLIQDNPIGNMTHLRNMVSMIKVGKKRECFMTMDTLIQLFIEDLLPPDRKLKFFSQQPLSAVNKIAKGGVDKRRRLLLLWHFEDQLKSIYIAFVRALNEAAHDSVEANKEKVIAAMHKLLSGHPEQEAVLLSSIVNKLGDPSHKIGSKVIYSLTKLLDSHPAMKGVVMEEVEKVVFRPNMSKRAQYYSVCFLTQFAFDSADAQLASSLISIYFALFKACIKTGDIDSRMMKALLTGVSRAYLYAKEKCGTLQEHINTVYKVVHLSSANVAINALALLYLVVGDPLTDRFMNVLYKKVGEPNMFKATQHAMFLSLIFKTIKRDTDDGRVCAVIKRLLQVAVHLPAPIVAGILMLVSETIHSKKNFKLRMEQEATSLAALPAENDLDDEEERYVDCDVEKPKPASTVTSPLNDTVEIKTEPLNDDGQVAFSSSSWFHAGLKPKTNSTPTGHYDPYQRNPLHAAGDKALPVELVQLTRHFHPTISLFATTILEGSRVSYTGDPLQDFSLIRFLDKFVFKNPKKGKPESDRVTSFARFGRKKYYSSVGLKRLRVNTEEYLKQEERIIPVDETFMFKYLKDKKELDVKKKVKKEEEDDSDVESVDDEEFEKIIHGVAGGNKDDLDFMREIGSLPASKDDKSEDEEDDDDDDEDEEDSDEGLDDDLDEEDEELGDLDGEEDGDFEDLGSDDGSLAEDFNGDEVDDWSDDAELESDEDDEPKSKVTKKSNKKLVKGTKNKSKKSSGLFASAEEFAEILEDENYRAGSSSALSNKDNAGIKQLKWETNRDHWIKGNNFKKNKRPGNGKGFLPSSGNRGKKFKKKSK